LSDCEDVPAALLSDTARVLPGEGVARLDDMLNALAAAGYTGDVSLKIFNQRIWDLEAEEAAKIVMAITEQYLPGKLSDVNAQDT
jgi:sugar phosphate isomerase/epimerase